MIKLVILILFALLLASAVPTVIYAEDITLLEGSTVALTGEVDADVTLSGSISITNLQTALEAHAAKITESNEELLAKIIGFGLLVFLNVMAFWHRERMLYILTGASFVTYGVINFSVTWYMGLILVLFGIYCFVKSAFAKTN